MHYGVCLCGHTICRGLAIGTGFVGEDWEQEDDITLLTLRRSVTQSWVSEDASSP